MANIIGTIFQKISKKHEERDLQTQAMALLKFYIDSQLPPAFLFNSSFESEKEIKDSWNEDRTSSLIKKGRGVRLWYVTITNEGAYSTLMEKSNPGRNKFIGMAINHKKMGKLSGQPDLWIGSAFHSLFIEFKSSKGKLSKNQQDVRLKILWAGIPHYVVKDLKHFVEIIDLHFGIKLGSV